MGLRVIDLVLTYGRRVLFQLGLATIALAEDNLMALEDGSEVHKTIRDSIPDNNTIFEVFQNFITILIPLDCP